MREAVLERIVGIGKAIIARSLKSIRLGFGSYQWLFDGGLGSFFFLLCAQFAEFGQNQVVSQILQ